jgi:four helix bundle protein
MSVKKLKVYQKAFDVSMDIFHTTKSFPADEKFGLISQIRRSSRSVCSNLAEAYRKRIYPAHFIAKVSDADMENTETQTWLDFSLACNYIDEHKYQQLQNPTIEIGKLLNHMLTFPEKYSIKKQTTEINN